jgi:hypothetical protein
VSQEIHGDDEGNDNDDRPGSDLLGVDMTPRSC